jgi:16S rRNA (cytosine967-C5)-methyltransferase
LNAAKPSGKKGKAQPKVQVQGSSRRAALSVLDAVLGRQIPLDLAFERAVGQQKLTGPDRGFARAMAATVLRRLGQIDDAVDPFLRRPLPKRAITPRNILRLGAAQILFLETPAHAAVSETTDLASGKNKTYRGLTNAVLRRIAEAGPELLEDQNAARLNTPEWLWQSWRKSYGKETALAIAEAHQLEPPLDISLLKGDPTDWPEKLEAMLLPTGSLRRTISAAVPDLAGFADGVWQVQDAAAALPARMLGDVSGKRVIDLCAAPGGKTSQLVSAGANVIAVDAGAERMPRVHENLKRLGLQAETIVADATEWRPETPVDAILLDAPCSSTGTIRRRPDVLWSKRPRDVTSLAEIQAELLRAAADMLKPGGMLVYACCSLEAEEGPDQIVAFLEACPEFARAPLASSEIAGLPESAITADGDLRTLPSMWPEHGGMDGFYAARLIKQIQ